MGIEQASCLVPNVSGKDSEIYKNNKGINKFYLYIKNLFK